MYLPVVHSDFEGCRISCFSIVVGRETDIPRALALCFSKYLITVGFHEHSSIVVISLAHVRPPRGGSVRGRGSAKESRTERTVSASLHAAPPPPFRHRLAARRGRANHNSSRGPGAMPTNMGRPKIPALCGDPVPLYEAEKYLHVYTYFFRFLFTR